ncbi:MAG: FtsH protease activity modulator HflK [Holosporales bacterium]|jgi:membrane protease subunit HflK|nr:FtsH protease activity modulator HflK [Holosporales bacterium]
MARNDFNPWDNDPPEGHNRQRPPLFDPEVVFGNLLRRLNKIWDTYRKKLKGAPLNDLKGGPTQKKILLLLVCGLGVLWLASGFYQVEPDERGVVLRFGEWVRTTSPGLHYHLPAPIETVLTQRMTTVHRIDIGAKPTISSDETPDEDLVLTGDSNIANISFSVLWRVKDTGVEHFLFNTYSPEHIIRSAAESVMREIVGQTPITYTQTEGRGAINDKAQELLQQTLDEYNVGVEIVQVLLQNVEPPAAVIDAFRDVERAQADQQSEVNKAEAYDRDLRARTRGQVASILCAAEAHRATAIAKAKGATAAFCLVLAQYRKAPSITIERLRIDSQRDIYEQTRKVVVDFPVGASGTPSIVPYFPLSDLEKVGKEGV